MGNLLTFALAVDHHFASPLSFARGVPEVGEFVVRKLLTDASEAGKQVVRVINFIETMPWCPG